MDYSYHSANSDRTIFPNPMSNIPYDAVQSASIGTVSATTWEVFMNTPPVLRKRQQLSSVSPIATSELLKLCPLNNVQSSDVASGCVAGIYSRFCYDLTNSTLLAQCHDAHNRAFTASIFIPLGDVCVAWKNGPFSGTCLATIKGFFYPLYMGKDIDGKDLYLNLNSTHANSLVQNIFRQPRYAPCVAPFPCNWKATAT